MNEQPSGIEAAALKPCPFCGGEAEIERYGDHSRSTIYQCTSCSCSLESGEEWGHGRRWNERACPAASGDLRERIARIVDPRAFETPKHPANDDAFWRGASREAALVKADLILASIPGLDEDAIRKDERGRCAKVAEGPVYNEKYRGAPGHNWFHIKQPGSMHDYGNGRLDAAAAIRSLKTGSGKP